MRGSGRELTAIFVVLASHADVHNGANGGLASLLANDLDFLLVNEGDDEQPDTKTLMVEGAYHAAVLLLVEHLVGDGEDVIVAVVVRAASALARGEPGRLRKSIDMNSCATSLKRDKLTVPWLWPPLLTW